MTNTFQKIFRNSKFFSWRDRVEVVHALISAYATSWRWGHIDAEDILAPTINRNNLISKKLKFIFSLFYLFIYLFIIIFFQ